MSDPLRLASMVAMSRARHLLIFRVGIVLLLAGHLDFWRPRTDLVWWGWLPGELAWRLGWMAAAFALLLHFTACIWREEDD